MTHAPEINITPNFVEDDQTLFQILRDEVQWEKSMSARYTASFGVPYNYSQMVYAEQPFHPQLERVLERLKTQLNIPFNNCLLNYYFNERSKMGFHSDETDNLLPETGVAILSLGEERDIHFRHRHLPETRASFTLPSGSLLFMGIAVQHDWVHAIKKKKGAQGRISATWRAFKPEQTQN